MTEKKTGKTKAVEKTKSADIVPHGNLELSPETVKKYINALASEQEITLFLNQCNMFQLNPFKREIYLIKYSQRDPANFVVGYEVYLKRADRSQKWDGISFGTEGTGETMTAWCKVYRKDWKEPLFHQVDFEEYAQRKGSGELNTFWKRKPKTMLKKVVIAQGLRMAFPDEFAGMPYIVEEMNDVDLQRMPDAFDRATDTTKIEEHFKEEDVKNPPEPKGEALFPDEVKAPQSLKMDVNRLVATLVDKYGFTPDKVLDKMKERVGTHEINELTKDQAEEIIECFEKAIDSLEAQRIKKEQARA